MVNKLVMTRVRVRLVALSHEASMPVVPDSVFDPQIEAEIAAARQAARVGRGGDPGQRRDPFPSPVDWRDHWIYFLMIDRFNNTAKPPNSGSQGWNRRFGRHQGGNFNGIRSQLGYLKSLGVGAIWITPVVKNPAADWEYNYHGYAAQDLLAIDPRLGSDGTRETAERELRELVDAAHDLGIYVILDIVLNHTARVFDYWINGELRADFADWDLLRSAPLAGREPEIAWLNGLGLPRADWSGPPPDPATLHPDDAVHPAQDFRKDYFRRRGSKLSDKPDWPSSANGFAVGDFGSMRQLVVEYQANPGDPLHEQWGRNPVLTLLVRAYSYLIARYDFDAFRIDTAKYVDPTMMQYFGNAIREFALSLGKANFFTFGEVWDSDATLARFVGRNGGNTEGFGIDAAKDFPLFQILRRVTKGLEAVQALPALFAERKNQEQELLSSHGEASRFFVTFLDNHDQSERIRHPQTPDLQVKQALGLLYTLQGIPCLYYGTEQDLQGTVDAEGNPDLAQFEGVREALWGKPNAFDTATSTFQWIQRLSEARRLMPALRYGRQYFRPISGNGTDFGPAMGANQPICFSRVLGDEELVVVANTSATQPFNGHVLIDPILNRTVGAFQLVFSSRPAASPTGAAAPVPVTRIPTASFWQGPQFSGSAPAASLPISLAPMEFQVLANKLPGG